MSLIAILLVAAVVGAYAQSSDSCHDEGLNLPCNERADEVNPQSGNLTVSSTEVAQQGE